MTQKYVTSGKIGHLAPMHWQDSIISGFEIGFDDVQKLVASMLEIDLYLRPKISPILYERFGSIS